MDDKTQALEYLKLARAEIFEKLKILNQTFGAYLVGAAGLAGWFYQALYKPVEKGASSFTDLQKASASIGFALLLSYLALAAFWIIYCNERIIAGLALYQRESLRSALGSDPKMWEDSNALKKLDDLANVLNMILFEECIVLTPPILALISAVWQASRQFHAANWQSRIMAGAVLIAAVAANVMTLWLGLEMRKTLKKLNPRASDPLALNGNADAQSHPTAFSQTQHNN